MKTLVVGATGATGRRLVEQLLNRGEQVRAIVRATGRVPEALRGREGLELIEASLLDLDDDALDHAVDGCGGIASCLGHTLSFKGVYGHPRRLVTDAVRRLAEAVRRRAPEDPVRFALMNTTGYQNLDLDEQLGFGERLIIALLRLGLPPHPDNEAAADFLRTEVGKDDPHLEWVVIRPDTLVDDEEVTPYELHASPVRSPLFDPGETSRVNVGAFMAALLTEDALWRTWRGQTPVIYNCASMKADADEPAPREEEPKRLSS